jgi:hypothetical protein
VAEQLAPTAAPSCHAHNSATAAPAEFVADLSEQGNRLLVPALWAPAMRRGGSRFLGTLAIERVGQGIRRRIIAVRQALGLTGFLLRARAGLSVLLRKLPEGITGIRGPRHAIEKTPNPRGGSRHSGQRDLPVDSALFQIAEDFEGFVTFCCAHHFSSVCSKHHPRHWLRRSVA